MSDSDRESKESPIDVIRNDIDMFIMGSKKDRERVVLKLASLSDEEQEMYADEVISLYIKPNDGSREGERDRDQEKSKKNMKKGLRLVGIGVEAGIPSELFNRVGREQNLFDGASVLLEVATILQSKKSSRKRKSRRYKNLRYTQIFKEAEQYADNVSNSRLKEKILRDLRNFSGKETKEFLRNIIEVCDEQIQLAEEPSEISHALAELKQKVMLFLESGGDPNLLLRFGRRYNDSYGMFEKYISPALTKWIAKREEQLEAGRAESEVVLDRILSRNRLYEPKLTKMVTGYMGYARSRSRSGKGKRKTRKGSR